MDLAAIRELTLGGFSGEIRELRTPAGLILDSVRFDFGPAKVETDPFELQLGKPGSFEARLTAEALEIFLNEKQPGGAREFTVRFSEGDIRVGATARVILEVRAEAVCTLRIEEVKRLCVELVSADVMGLGADTLVQRQIEAINPVVDASSWPIDLDLTAVEIGSDAVKICGLVRGIRTV